MSWMDGQGVGYYGWAWDTWAGLISNYSNGTPASPWGTDYYNHIKGRT
jgi:hypothetical protein